MKKVLNASEIGTYCYCTRAWYLQKQGAESENTAAIAAGNRFHHKVGRQVSTIRFIRAALVILILAAMVFLILSLKGNFPN